MLIMIAGDYLTGKTVSACTFPKPLTLLDFDGNFISVKNVKGKDGKLLCGDINQIKVIPFTRTEIASLSVKTDMGKGGNGAPIHTKNSMMLLDQYNTVIKELNDETHGPIKTLVIDSLSSVFRAWKDSVLYANGIPSLRSPDWGTLQGMLFGQFLTTLKYLCTKIPYVILTNHIAMEKDELSGRILEHPVGPSNPAGRLMGQKFDEVWLQKQEGSEYVWRTRKNGFFQAGSRSNLPDPIKPATFDSIKKYMEVT